MSRTPDNQLPQRRWPSREEYLQNERARKIREVCVEIIRAARELMDSREVFEDEDRQQQLYTTLERLDGKLVELGITSYLHAEKPPEAFRDPILMAENVASNLRGLTGRQLPSVIRALPQTLEFGEEKAGDIQGLQSHLLQQPKDWPESIKDFWQLHNTLQMCSYFLDADKEVRKK